MLLPRCTHSLLGEGLGDGFAAFWAGEGLVEVFEDVAAAFAEEGVFVLPFVFACSGFRHHNRIRHAAQRGLSI